MSGYVPITSSTFYVYFSLKFCEDVRFEPPTGHTERACIMHTGQDDYVQSCPSLYENTETARLCSEGPAAFVYSVRHPEAVITQSYLGLLSFLEVTMGRHQLSITFSGLGVKYRNSHCAVCHGAWQIGCDVRKTYDTDNEEKFQAMYAGYDPMAFKYVLDFTSRSCRRDSDYYLTYPDRETGRDICDGISAELRSCNCSQVFDIFSQRCIEIDMEFEQACDRADYHGAPLLPSTYINSCNGLDEYEILPSNEREAACSRCQNDLDHSCELIEESRYNFSQAVPRQVHLEIGIQCAVSLLTPRCPPKILPSECSFFLYGRGKGSGIWRADDRVGLTILNSITFSHSKKSFFVTFIPPVDNEESAFKGMFSKSLNIKDVACTTYNFTDDAYVLCPSGVLRAEDGTIVDDFSLDWGELRVCTEKQRSTYSVEIYDYVLLGISLAAILIYNICYLVKLPHTITGNVVFCSLSTTFLAQFAYLISNIDDVTESSFCPVLALIKLYLFLSMMFWTNSLAIWIATGITRTELASSQTKKSFVWCALHGWVSPLIFVCVAFVLQYGPRTGFYPVLTSGSPCFLDDTNYVRLLVFLGPIYLLILINTIMTVFSAGIICCRNQASCFDRDRRVKNIMIVVKLVFLFGLHWVLLPFADHIIEPRIQAGLWAATKVLTELQGFLVVLSQVIKLSHIREAINSLASFIRTNSTSGGESATRSSV